MNDGRKYRSIRWPHEKACSFCASWKKPSYLSLIFSPVLPWDYSCSSTMYNTSGRAQKKGQLHLRLLNKCITVWALCPGLSGSLTWNVPMRQSGATGAWQHAAGRDNLLWDTEQRAVKVFPSPGRLFSKTLSRANTGRAMWNISEDGGWLLNRSSTGVMSVDSSSCRLVWLSQHDSLKGWSAVRFCLAWGEKIHFYQEKVMSVPASQEMHQHA